MSWLGRHWLVLLMLAVFVGIMARHAWQGRRQTKGLADYYVGGRAMGGVALGISFFATYSSTNSFVGFSGQAYSYGAAWLLLTPLVVLFAAAAWWWIAPRLREVTASLGSLTIPDYIGFRFQSETARVIAALIVLFASFLYMTAVYKGIGHLLGAFLDLPFEGAIAIVVLIVMLYTAVGGFISVVKTDVVQGIVMMVAAVVLFAGTVRAAGGLGTIAGMREDAATTALFAWDTAMPFPVLLGLMVAGSVKFMTEPRQLSRFYALENAREARKGMWTATAAFLGVYALLLPIGLYAHRVVGSGFTDTDLVTPALITSGAVFPPAVSAFLVLAMIAAAMSSLDSVLLVMASTCQRDIVARRSGGTEAQMVFGTRVYVALFALVTAGLALASSSGIVFLTAFSGSLYGACFGPAVVLGLYWGRGNGGAVLASFALGLGCLLIWNHTPLSEVVHRVFPAILLSTLGYVLVARYTPNPMTAPVKA